TLSLTGSLGFTATYVSLDGANRRYLGEDGDAVWTGNDGKTQYNPAYIGALTWGGADTGLIPVTAPADAVAGPEIAPVVGTHRYHRLNPALGLAWNPVRALGLFASYSEAMRAPTAIELACA
ncbi:TonB-dependent receptor, partial [Acinetobacter baumannii]